MDYRVASNIRGKSLSSLMTDKIVSGGGVGSALSGAISDKLKAKATGIKEKFDPMNIARAMTGGSRLAPAILGRLTGRSQSDINYFAGGKNQKSSYTQVPTQMTTPGEGLGGSAVEVLNRMLSFMQNSREEDLKRKDTAKQFVEEQKVEEQRKHNEFLKVLKEYTSLGTTTLVGKKEDEGGGLFDFITKSLDSLKEWVNGLLSGFKWLDSLKWMVGLVSAPAMVAALIAAGLGAAVIALWKAENDKFKELGGKKAEELSAKRQTEEVLGAGDPGALGSAIMDVARGEESTGDKLKKTVAEKQEVVRALMEDEGFDASAYDKNGGYIFKDIEGKAPSAELLKNVSKRADTLIESGEPLPQVKSKKKLLPYGVKESTGRSNAQLLDYQVQTEPTGASFGVRPKGIKSVKPAGTTQSDVRKIDNDVMSTPVPEVPISSRMNSAIDENQDLNLSNNTDTQSFISPVVSSTTSSVDLPDRPIPATALVRDKTPILDYVLQSSMSPV